MLPSVGHSRRRSRRASLRWFSPLRCFRALGTFLAIQIAIIFLRFRRSDASERWAHGGGTECGRLFVVFASPMLPSVGHAITTRQISDLIPCFRRSDASERWALHKSAPARVEVARFRRSDASERWAHLAWLKSRSILGVFAAPMLPSVGHLAMASKSLRESKVFAAPMLPSVGHSIGKEQFRESSLGFRRSDASERWARSRSVAVRERPLVFAAPMLPSVGHRTRLRHHSSLLGEESVIVKKD